MELGTIKLEDFKVIQRYTLFEIDWAWVRANNRCGLCGSKLYDMRKSPDKIYCKSKKHQFFSIKKWN